MNRVELIGYLGKDPQFFELPSGATYAIIRLATDSFYSSHEGKMVKETQWHTAKIWGKEQIDKIKNYIIKGSHILINGELDYRNFRDKQGQSRNMTEIRVKYLIDLDR